MKLANLHKVALQGILDRLKRRPQKVLVMGDVGLDRYTVGVVDRISPEAPVPIVRVESEFLKLGLAANVADNIRSLGSDAVLLGVIGSDRVGQDFRKVLKKQRISDKHLIIESRRRTVLKERIVSERQQLLRIDYEDSDGMSKLGLKKLNARLERLVPEVDIIILEDYCKGMVQLESTKRLFSLAARHGKKILVDPNSKSPASLYSGAYVLTPNTQEAEALSGTPISSERDLSRAGFVLLKKTQAERLIITRGKEGMAIFERGSRGMQLIPTYAREVYDVSGAGDTVISSLALALAAGSSIEDAARLANLAAAIEVSKRGTATVNIPEIQEALSTWA